ncbi:hypothetical protein Desti_0951 [Desulfomonile tiedjei DSM 6799]|uniref:Uncharacterized protein n=1 Tax=Desulfomonile tiedjei (strain ATCC 49306 / DSM 6799 / DCB-1) TaxID=706587 RepID=I4C279_DESTA|nr:hypothetical protein Desti_0951 [Desulfomonile tiedjei DSM 6799]
MCLPLLGRTLWSAPTASVGCGDQREPHQSRSFATDAIRFAHHILRELGIQMARNRAIVARFFRFFEFRDSFFIAGNFVSAVPPELENHWFFP